MRLSFDFQYEDYEDSEKWLPRLEELKAVTAVLEQADAAGLSDDDLTDRLEDVEELMRYYAAVSDYKRLEPVMRLQYKLLEQGEQRGLSCIAFQYFRFEYGRVNAILYRVEGQNRKSAEEYMAACEIEEQCFHDLLRDTILRDPQKLYIGWACQELLNEAAQVYDSIMEYEKAIVCCDQAFTVLQWLEPYMNGSAGIQDKTADLYCTYGGIFFQNGKPEQGRDCYKASVRMYESLAEKYDSDFWNARSLWVMSLYGIQEFLFSADANIMLECEKKCDAALEREFTGEREIAIAGAAKALVLLQKGMACQQNNLPLAIGMTKDGIGLCKNALAVLEKDMEQKGTTYRSIIMAITARMFTSYIGALDFLGAQLYASNQYGEAENAFQEALELLTNPTDYALSEVAVTIIRAECLHYMALLSMEDGDTDAFLFYAEQAVSLTSNLASKVRNEAVFRIEGFACSLLAEYYLTVKNKAKALQYTERGLSACEEWQKYESGNGPAQLAQLLEKSKRKASRRFF